jgi:hypothetical protein
MAATCRFALSTSYLSSVLSLLVPAIGADFAHSPYPTVEKSSALPLGSRSLKAAMEYSSHPGGKCLNNGRAPRALQRIGARNQSFKEGNFSREADVIMT